MILEGFECLINSFHSLYSLLRFCFSCFLVCPSSVGYSSSMSLPWQCRGSCIILTAFFHLTVNSEHRIASAFPTSITGLCCISFNMQVIGSIKMEAAPASPTLSCCEPYSLAVPADIFFFILLQNFWVRPWINDWPCSNS